MDTPTLVFGIVGIAGTAIGTIGAGLALYVRLSLKSFIVDTLNGRYPTKELMTGRFDAIDAHFASIKESINDLPCKIGGYCDVHAIRQLEQTVAMIATNVKAISGSDSPDC